ncbi:Probable alpha-galactosidase A, partial [Gryllus bimaculatus]
MGWMSWERFRCIIDCQRFPDECISDRLFRTAADLLVSEGYAEAGYEYVIIDDCWLSKERDRNRRLQPDPERFPHGMKQLASYIHGKGLKFGMYENCGPTTCEGYPGSINHLQLDAQTFADWDVDYIKFDGCYVDIKILDRGYPAFGYYLNKTGRPMVYSCSWPYYYVEKGKKPNMKQVSKHCNLWRNYYDIQDSWSVVQAIIKWFGENHYEIDQYAGPGHWNDPDMLIIGNYGLSLDQSKTQMAIWAILAAPLIMSNDLRTIRPEFKDILLNREIIAINQDVLGIQGRRVKKEKDITVWIRPVTPVGYTHSYAVALASNRVYGDPYIYSVRLNEIGLTNPAGYNFKDLYGDKECILYPHQNLTVRINPSARVENLKYTRTHDKPRNEYLK